MLDTYREVVTPEGVSLHLPAAGPVPRAVAWVIDLVIRGGLMMLVGIVLGLLGAVGQGLYLVLLFLVFWAYPIVFEALWNGCTPGKKAMSLRVVAADGAPVGWLPAITRNLLRTVDMLPFGYATGLVASLVDAHGRRLGDLVAGTLVVHDARGREPVAAPANAVLAPPVALQPAEQAALVAFGERAPLLTPSRQSELANLLEPLTQARGEPAVLRVFGMANWLLGRR
jgi:uncharacterized RDD family membrane protein YckC